MALGRQAERPVCGRFAAALKAPRIHEAAAADRREQAGRVAGGEGADREEVQVKHRSRHPQLDPTEERQHQRAADQAGEHEGGGPAHRLELADSSGSSWMLQKIAGSEMIAIEPSSAAMKMPSVVLDSAVHHSGHCGRAASLSAF
jgi:hypothetical protein